MQSEASFCQVERYSRRSFTRSWAAYFKALILFFSIFYLSKAVVKSSSISSTSGKLTSVYGISLKSSLTDKQATIIITKRRTLYLVAITIILENLGLKGSFDNNTPSSLILVASIFTFRAKRELSSDLLFTSSAPRIVRWRKEDISDGNGGIVTKGNCSRSWAPSDFNWRTI